MSENLKNREMSKSCRRNNINDETCEGQKYPWLL